MLHFKWIDTFKVVEKAKSKKEKNVLWLKPDKCVNKIRSRFTTAN